MPETTFEQKFGQLVDSQILERLPSLVNSRVGFQIIDKDDDDTKAVGVAAFVLDGIWIYIPVFFLKGAIKGFDLMYIQQRDLFIPSMDNWIAALSQRGLSALGNSFQEGDRRGQLGETPFSTPENTHIFKGASSKYASDNNSILDSATLQGMCRTVETSGDTVPNTPDILSSIPMFGKVAAQSLLATIAGKPEFMGAMLQFYTADDIEKIARCCADIATTPTPDVDKSVEIFTRETLRSKEASQGLSKAERKMVASNGVFVRDNRDNLSQVYNESVDSSILQNPTHPGVYDIIMADGSFKTFIVLFPKSFSDPTITSRRYSRNVGNSIALIDTGNPREYLKTKTTDVFARPTSTSSVATTQGGRSATRKNLAGLESDTKVLLVQSPSRVLEITINQKRRRTATGGFMVTIANSRGFSDELGMNRDNMDAQVEFVDRESAQLNITSGTLFVPKGTRMFTYQDPWITDQKLVAESDGSPGGQYTPKHLSLGTSDTVRREIFKQADLHMVRVYSQGPNLYHIFEGDSCTEVLNKEASLRRLTLGHGIFAGTAQHMLRVAHKATSKDARFFVKHAASYDIAAYGESKTPYMGGPSPKEEYAVREERNEHRGKPLSGARDSGGAMLPGQVIQRAMQSAEAGIKEVFDVTVIQGLIDRADISELRKDYISDMIRGMDRVGRMLLLFYWHQEDFEDKYGRQDLQELEDTLRKVFQSTGDLILFLKEKTGYSPDAAESLFGQLSEDVAL